MLSDDALSQLHAAVQSAPSLAIDESSDVTDNAQLLVYVRLFHQDKKEICEDLLGLTPLETLFCLLEGLMLFLCLFEMKAWCSCSAYFTCRPYALFMFT